MKRAAILIFSLLLVFRSYGQSKDVDQLQTLARDFWTWRAQYAPFTTDDVNRMERPGGTRNWSAAAIEKRRVELAQFETRWKQLDAGKWPVPQQVDYRLIGSALARVHWELDINPRWQRDPNFYLDQTLAALAEALTVPAPYDESRSREILARIENIPAILQQGSENLKNPPKPFATVAITTLQGVRERLQRMATALAPSTTLRKDELDGAVTRAAVALEQYRTHLEQIAPSLPNESALGRDAYVFFLKNVALVPFSPEEILAMGRQEWDRAVAFEAYEQNRNKDVPPLKICGKDRSVDRRYGRQGRTDPQISRRA